MNDRLAKFLNPALSLFGRKIIRTYLGHWYATRDGLRRIQTPVGWRLATIAECSSLPDNATELDRFVATHQKEIEKRSI